MVVVMVGFFGAVKKNLYSPSPSGSKGIVLNR